MLVPCYNEELTVAKVVSDFTRALPGARVLVYDNNSTDKTAIQAREAGALVHHAPRQGKGNVVKQMFDEVDAEVYLMVDGDDTYPASSAADLIAELKRTGADMVVGVRMFAFEEGSFRRFHQLGNHLVAGLISRLFSSKVTDVLSGYRAFSREILHQLPLQNNSNDFVFDNKMLAQIICFGYRIGELTCPTRYFGEASSINFRRSVKYGFGVLKTSLQFRFQKWGLSSCPVFSGCPGMK